REDREYRIDRDNRVTDFALEVVDSRCPIRTREVKTSGSALGCAESETFFTSLMDVVDVTPVPKEAAHLLHPKLRLLAALCVVLQRNAGDKDFSLSCHCAGPLLGVSHKQAWLYLRALCDQKLLKLTTKGSQRRANRYRCLMG